MSTAELRDLIASLALAQRETDRQQQQTDRQLQQTVRQIKELGQQDMREAVLAEGWHLVHVGDDLFKVETPKGFQPRIYQAAP